MQGICTHMHIHNCVNTIIKSINTVHTQKSDFGTEEFALFVCSYDSL